MDGGGTQLSPSSYRASFSLAGRSAGEDAMVAAVEDLKPAGEGSGGCECSQWPPRRMKEEQVLAAHKRHGGCTEQQEVTCSRHWGTVPGDSTGGAAIAAPRDKIPSRFSHPCGIPNDYVGFRKRCFSCDMHLENKNCTSSCQSKLVFGECQSYHAKVCEKLNLQCLY